MVKTNMIGFIWHIILYMKSSNMIHSIVQTKVDRCQLFATLSQKKGRSEGPDMEAFHRLSTGRWHSAAGQADEIETKLICRKNVSIHN